MRRCQLKASTKPTDDAFERQRNCQHKHSGLPKVPNWIQILTFHFSSRLSNFWFPFPFRIWDGAAAATIIMKVWYCMANYSSSKHFQVSKLLVLLAARFHRKVSHAVVFVVVRGAASKLSFSRQRQSHDQFALELQRMRRAFSESNQDISLVWWNSKHSKLRAVPPLTSSPKCW